MTPPRSSCMRSRTNTVPFLRTSHHRYDYHHHNSIRLLHAWLYHQTFLFSRCLNVTKTMVHYPSDEKRCEIACLAKLSALNLLTDWGFLICQWTIRMAGPAFSAKTLPLECHVWARSCCLQRLRSSKESSRREKKFCAPFGALRDELFLSRVCSFSDHGICTTLIKHKNSVW